MNDSQIFPLMHNGQLRDAVLAHLVERVDHQRIRVDGLGIGGHDLRGLHLLNVGVFHQHAAQVAIGDDTQQFIAVAHHRGTQSFVGHLNDDLRQVVIRSHLGTFVAGIEVFHSEIELLAERTARMELGEIVGGEATTPH